MEDLSESEKRLRRSLVYLYRFAFATFFSWQLFDFLFSPIWMHGYLWCLNQPLDKDLSDKSAGYIMDFQMDKVGSIERIISSGSHVAAVAVVLKLAGYADRDRHTWELLRLSMLLGLFSGMARCVQVQQRLFSAFHDVFFTYLNFFIVSLFWTMFPYRIVTDVVKVYHAERVEPVVEQGNNRVARAG